MSVNNVFIPVEAQSGPVTKQYFTGRFLGLVQETQGLILGFRRVLTTEEWSQATEEDRKWRVENGLDPIEYPGFTPEPTLVNIYTVVKQVPVKETEENLRVGRVLKAGFDKQFGANGVGVQQKSAEDQD